MSGLSLLHFFWFFRYPTSLFGELRCSIRHETPPDSLFFSTVLPDYSIPFRSFFCFPFRLLALTPDTPHLLSSPVVVDVFTFHDHPRSLSFPHPS